MNEEPRLFADGEAVRHIGQGLINRSLPKKEWTHEAHLGACLWLITDRTDIAIDREIRGIISGYNAAVGGVNDDHHGYHDTISHAFIAAVRHWLADSDAITLVDRVNGLLRAPEGRRDWPLGYYSRDLLFSVAARRDFLAPDLAPLP